MSGILVVEGTWRNLTPDMIKTRPLFVWHSPSHRSDHPVLRCHLTGTHRSLCDLRYGVWALSEWEKIEKIQTYYPGHTRIGESFLHIMGQNLGFTSSETLRPLENYLITVFLSFLITNNLFVRIARLAINYYLPSPGARSSSVLLCME